MVDGRVFVYGFDATKEEVTEEWLAATNTKGKESDIFTRKGRDIEFGDADVTSGQALKALQLLGVRQNQLLNKIADLDSDHRGKLLDQVVWWFRECLPVIPAAASFDPILEYLDEADAFRNFASEFLSSIGTGIGRIAVEQTQIAAEPLPKALIEQLQSSNDVEQTPIAVGPGMSLYLDPDDPAKVIRRNLASQHTVGKQNYTLLLDEESDGTQRFLHLLPALYHLHTSCKVFVIDELDQSLHPLLAHALLKFFVEACPGACQQLFVTTHETNLLDQDLMRSGLPEKTKTNRHVCTR